MGLLNLKCYFDKVQLFWEGFNNLKKSVFHFVLATKLCKKGEDWFKFCGHFTIFELYCNDLILVQK